MFCLFLIVFPSVVSSCFWFGPEAVKTEPYYFEPFRPVKRFSQGFWTGFPCNVQVHAPDSMPYGEVLRNALGYFVTNHIACLPDVNVQTCQCLSKLPIGQLLTHYYGHSYNYDIPVYVNPLGNGIRAGILQNADGRDITFHSESKVTPVVFIRCPVFDFKTQEQGWEYSQFMTGYQPPRVQEMAKMHQLVNKIKCVMEDEEGLDVTAKIALFSQH